MLYMPSNISCKLWGLRIVRARLTWTTAITYCSLPPIWSEISLFKDTWTVIRLLSYLTYKRSRSKSVEGLLITLVDLLPGGYLAILECLVSLHPSPAPVQDFDLCLILILLLTSRRWVNIAVTSMHAHNCLPCKLSSIKICTCSFHLLSSSLHLDERSF